MSSTAALIQTLEPAPALAAAAVHGLSSIPATLPPWLFYDETGSRLFEEITRLPEYYLTRTERDLFRTHAGAIFNILGCPMSDTSSSDVGIPLTIVELGAGTATKTGILLRALTLRQPHVLYQPIDISPSALDEASDTLTHLPGLTIRPCVANYITDPVSIERAPGARVLALYIGSSIGNFSPAEARAILQNLRANLEPGDALLLGTDLAPSPAKSVSTLLAAYNDASGTTAAFNRNILHRLNRELGADFAVDRFRHFALWNAAGSRIEMHLQSTCSQTVHIPGTSASAPLTVHFAPGQTIHTENSYKFTRKAIASLLHDSGFAPTRTFTDPNTLFAVTLAHTL